MLTRSKSNKMEAESQKGDVRSECSSASSVARRKARQAELARSLADLELESIAARKKVILAEFEADVAQQDAEEVGESAMAETRSHGGSSAYTAAWVGDVASRQADAATTSALQEQSVPLQSSGRAQPFGAADVLSVDHIRREASPARKASPEPSTRAAEPVSGTPANELLVSTISALSNAIADLASTSKVVAPARIVNLPVFDGNILEWLLFKKSFSETRTSFSNSENMCRLRAALRGEAREAVTSLLVTSSEPDEVLSALELRFARPELIVVNEVNQLKIFPKLRSASDLLLLSSKVRNCVSVVKLLHYDAYLLSPDLINSVLSKLSPLQLNRWCDYAIQHCRFSADVRVLADFLDIESRKALFLPEMLVGSVASSPHVGRAKPTVAPFSTARPAQPAQLSRPELPPQISCAYCLGSHSLKSCLKFEALPVAERRSWVRSTKLCPKCLKKGKHDWKSCRAVTCGICGGGHHRLLHSGESNVVCTVNNILPDCQPSTSQLTQSPLTAETIPVTSNRSVSLPTNESVHAVAKKDGMGRVLLKILPVVISGPRGECQTLAMLDDGSTVTLIDAALAEVLGVEGPEQQIRMDGIAGRHEISSMSVNFNIRGKYSEESFSISGARTFPNLLLTPQSIDVGDLAPCRYLEDIAGFLTYPAGTPKVLVGASHWHLLISRENRLGTPAQPAASRTALGWVMFGPVSGSLNPVQFVNHCAVTEENDTLDTLIRDFFRIDSIGIKQIDPLLPEELRAVEILDTTSRRLPNGRFEVGLPWREDDPRVPDSYNHAKSRLLGLNKRFARDSNFAKLYKENVEAYTSKGYAEECLDTRDDPTSASRRWYLPHFGVTNVNKPGKLRIVHDAAAKSSGVSLNSLLLTGPDLLQSSLGILLRFREGRVALNGDIREMFPQIKVRELDRDCQRYLWQPDGPAGPIREFRMSSLIFGAASSPFTAIYIKNRNAREFAEIFPDAATAIIEDHYMDDYLGSVDSVEQAARLAADIVEVHAKCGFEMRSWVSNEAEALKLIPPHLQKDEASAVNLDFEKCGLRVLGVFWNPKDDFIYFKSKILYPDQYTKRQVLRDLMRVYDPLGFLCPLITKGKILFQSTWRLVTKWDDLLPQSEVKVWEEWYRDIGDLTSIRVPRCYILRQGAVSRELHVFVDASAEAYSCVAYWRYAFPDGSFKVAYILSKSRVASLKPVTIPRLELQAALLGARLAKTVCESSREKFIGKRCFWSDSQTVLAWLRSNAWNFKTFVRNRVGEINELTSPSEWRWIPTGQNAADGATRANIKGLVCVENWIQGPSFLLLPNSQWPEEPSSVSQVENLESCNEIILQPVSVSLPVPNFQSFSSWQRLLRATARAYQFLRLLRERAFQARSRVGRLYPLLAIDIKLAEIVLYKRCQEDSFAEELMRARQGIPFPKSSRLKNLPASIDSAGVLRVEGRLSQSYTVDENIKRPIILDGRHHIVKLLVSWHHIWAGHANRETVVNQLRQRFWILHLRPTVRSVAASCRVCRIKRATPIRPSRGLLPEERLASHRRPFTYCGVDYFGPLEVSVGRRREKRWIALFTCLTCRAVHLEVVGSLSADAAIMALRRFLARRGCPEKIYSDNGTSFIGASREIRQHWRESVGDIAEYAESRQIEWLFIPPSSPFMGGCWERLVKSVKIALSATLKSRAPKEEVLVTLLSEAEHIVNARPLTHVPVAAEDEPALTPNHFLIGSASNLPGDSQSLTDRDLLGRRNWRKALRLADLFWARWIKEYLPGLTPRQGSNERHPGLAVGDLVFVADGTLPRGMWPRGRVIAIYPGRDGVVRVADVATSGGTLRRPVRKLVRVPLED